MNTFELPSPMGEPKSQHESMMPPAGQTEMQSQFEQPQSSHLPQPMQQQGQASQMQPLQPIVPPTGMPSVPPQGYMPAPILSPATADDVDLIEREWVEKAKMIIERTRQDPHQQTAAISQFKADYIKKRYNKDIKTADGSR